MESTIFSMAHLNEPGFIHHDPTKFALAVRTLLFARQHGRQDKKSRAFFPQKKAPRQVFHKGEPLLCDYRTAIINTLTEREFRPSHLRDVMLDLTWRNRDIQISHFNFIAGARTVPADEWERNTEWDSVLGYYDTQDRYIKIHD